MHPEYETDYDSTDVENGQARLIRCVGCHQLKPILDEVDLNRDLVFALLPEGLTSYH